MKTDPNQISASITQNLSRFLRRRWFFTGIVIITLISGWWLTVYVGRFVDQLKRRELQQLVKIGSAGINEQRIQSLTGTLKDQKNPDWQAIRNRFLAMLKADSSLRWIYMMNKRDSVIFFYMDTPEPDNAVPGELYLDAPPELYDVFSDQKARTAGPYTDRWGTFISAFQPIIDTDKKDIIAVVGFDIQASEWNRMIINQQLAPAVITLLIILLECVLFVYIRRRHHH